METIENDCNKTREELIIELQELKQEFNSLETLSNIKARDLIFQNEGKEQRAAELVIANKELAQEIAERMVIENSLRSLSQRQEALLFSIPEIIVEVDINKTYTWANKSALEFFGDDLIGHSASEYFVGMQDTYDVAQPLFDGNQDFVHLGSYQRRKDGEERLLDWYCSTLRDENGSVTGVLSSARDITDVRKIEEALRQSEENFSRSISESSLGIRITNIDEKTVYANKAFLDIYEFDSLEEFINTPSKNRYTPESYIEHQKRKEKRRSGQEVHNYEISIIRKNNEIRHVEVSRKEVLWNGEKHYQVISKDITEQRNLTRDLIIAKEKAEESDCLKTAFLSNISHEIRTPMNGILGFSLLLKEPNLTGKKQKEYIDIIQKSGARMLNIINDIMDISKIESRQINVSISEVDMNEQLDFIYTIFQPEVEQKGLRVYCKYPLSEKKAIIQTDPEKVHSILTKLINNALKFTQKGVIEFGYIQKGEYLEFFVKDTGVGISPDKTEHIFGRFQQGSESLSRGYEGAGLGLSISKAFVEMLGGKIWVESEEGLGSTFYFTLPFNPRVDENIGPKRVVLADPGAILMSNLKILIADDDEVSRLLLFEMTKPFTQRILFAATGVEAVEALRAHPDINLVLMDMKMPEMGGCEATRGIRQFNEGVIIIAQTAYSLFGDREMALAAGCNEYISKPIQRKLLTELITKYFGNE